MKKALGHIGFSAFALGLLIAIVAGIFAPSNAVIIIILVILGLIIGALNITGKEIVPFMVATIALVVVVGVFEPIRAGDIGTVLDDILNLIATLMAPAAVIVAVRALWAIGFPGERKSGLS